MLFIAAAWFSSPVQLLTAGRYEPLPCAKLQLRYAYTHGKQTVILRSVRGQFQSAHGKLMVSSLSIHGQLAVSVNILYLHLNESVNTNGHANVTGRPSGRW